MRVFINGLFTEAGIFLGYHGERRIPLSKPYAERVAVLIYTYGWPVGDHSNAGVTGGVYEVDDLEASAELMNIIAEAEINNEAFWSSVFDILVRECGADERDREYFVDYCQRNTVGIKEFRFRGALGGGGKLKRNSARIWVDCYPEDETEERRTMIARANEQIDALTRQ